MLFQKIIKFGSIVLRVAPRVLEAAGIHKSFAELKAVVDLSLTVDEGQCVALLGPNGAGKTTTVEMLEGLLAPDRGQITLLNQSLSKNRRQILEKVGVVLQETSLYKRFTVLETLELFASFYRESLEPEDVLEKLNLTEKRKVRLMKLSGGQKQRVYLGCALINDPKLVFLDEPTTGLDPQARRSIWNLLKVWKREGRSILLTTHYMEEAEYLADNVYIMDRGEIIVSGSPASLIASHCGEQVMLVKFKSDDEGTPMADSKLALLGEKCPWFKGLMAVGDGYELATVNDPKLAQDLYQAARALTIEIEELSLRRSTLEDVFLKLTGRSIRED
jgi:ABC-2 type transport system ATP-binding protein